MDKNTTFIGPPPDIDEQGNTKDNPAQEVVDNEDEPPPPPQSPKPKSKMDSVGNKKEPPSKRNHKKQANLIRQRLMRLTAENTQLAAENARMTTEIQDRSGQDMESQRKMAGIDLNMKEQLQNLETVNQINLTKLQIEIEKHALTKQELTELAEDNQAIAEQALETTKTRNIELQHELQLLRSQLQNIEKQSPTSSPIKQQLGMAESKPTDPPPPLITQQHRTNSYQRQTGHRAVKKKANFNTLSNAALASMGDDSKAKQGRQRAATRHSKTKVKRIRNRMNSYHQSVGIEHINTQQQIPSNFNSSPPAPIPSTATNQHQHYAIPIQMTQKSINLSKKNKWKGGGSSNRRYDSKRIASRIKSKSEIQKNLIQLEQNRQNALHRSTPSPVKLLQEQQVFKFKHSMTANDVESAARRRSTTETAAIEERATSARLAAMNYSQSNTASPRTKKKRKKKKKKKEIVDIYMDMEIELEDEDLMMKSSQPPKSPGLLLLNESSSSDNAIDGSSSNMRRPGAYTILLNNDNEIEKNIQDIEDTEDTEKEVLSSKLHSKYSEVELMLMEAEQIRQERRVKRTASTFSSSEFYDNTDSLVETDETDEDLDQNEDEKEDMFLSMLSPEAGGRIKKSFQLASVGGDVDLNNVMSF